MPFNWLIRLLGLNTAIKPLHKFFEGCKNQSTSNPKPQTSQKLKSSDSFKIKGLKERIRSLKVINDFSNQLSIHAADVVKKAPKKKILTVSHKQGIIKVTFKDAGWRKLHCPRSLPMGARFKKGYAAYYHKKTEALVYIADRIAVKS